MTRKRGVLIVALLLAGLVLTPGLAAADNHDGDSTSEAEEETDSFFDRSESLLLTALNGLGIIVFLLGLGLLGLGASSDSSSKGIKYMLVGGLIYMAANSISYIKSVLDFLAPGMLGF